MSGAEAIAILSVLSSIISIIDGTKQVYDAATNAQGLPEAFREVSGRLPIVSNILGSAKQHVDNGNVDEESCEGVRHVIEACKKKAKKLDDLFRKAIPADCASDLKRYYKAVKAFGKGNEVEKLMRGILEDVQLLACEHGMKIATKAQQEQIARAIIEVSAVAPSVPENLFQETGFTAHNSGPGTQYNAHGENIAQGNARQYNSAGGGMHFGSMADEAQDCLSTLFLTDPRDDREKLIQVKGSRVDGTCEWIKSHYLYNWWLRSRSQLLWLSGGPGKGKTMLSIFLAQELEQIAKLRENTLFLQYFCDNKDEKRNTAVTVIRGLIFQLLQSRRKLFDHILPSFKIQNKSLFTDSSFETLWRIFESIVCDPILGTTYCVLDGLDECDEASLEALLGKFATLLSAKTNGSSACALNLIVVSRDLPDFIPELLSSFPRIRLDPDADAEINDDVHRFIETKVDELSTRKQYPETLRIHVKEIFRNRAQGTFLWVGIVAQVLRRYKVIEVEKALDLFPPGLDELYARMLLQIDVERRDTAAKILRWVVMAVRPLNLSELSVAIETTIGNSVVGLDRDEVTRIQVSYCGYFLTIEENKVGLIHQSAKDYLLRKTCDSNPELEAFRVKEETVNLEIARKCLSCLQNSALPNSEVHHHNIIANLKNFPLLSYAARHWPQHARFLASSEDIFNLPLPFFNRKSELRTSWSKTCLAMEVYGDLPKSFTLLHLASYFGILPLAENLLLKKGWIHKAKRTLDLNKRDDQGYTALSWAAFRGHEATVQLLLEKGADINIQHEYAGTVLMIAAKGGNETIVRLLLEKGADINAQCEYGGTALMKAADGGHEAMVLLLLEKGANINAQEKSWGTALMRVAGLGNRLIMQLLLEKGADINAQSEFGWSALMRAAERGNMAIVQLLLEKGADINVKTDNRDTALIRAAIRGHETMVRLLLEKGADINTQHQIWGTVLMVAAKGGHKATVRLLLEKGADINGQDKYEGTALISAAEGGYEATVRLLLEKGADIDAKTYDGETALMRAASNGHQITMRLLEMEAHHGAASTDDREIALVEAAQGGYDATVRLLLEKGADINTQHKIWGTALMKAAGGGHETIVRLLLEKGADINAKINDGETALMRAASSGHEIIMRLLEKEGYLGVASINDREIALVEAAQGGYEAIVRLLLEKGADINAQDKWGGTALVRAVRGGHEAIVRLLLKNGADINAQDKLGGTALVRAVRDGHEAIVRLQRGKEAHINAELSSDREMAALRMTARGRHEAIVRLLLEKGVNIKAETNEGKTALMRAAKRGYEAIVRLLTP